MPRLVWSKVDPGSSATAQTERWQAEHGATQLAVWHSPEDGSWGYEIRERNVGVEQLETGAASTCEQAQLDAEARAADRNLLR
jgi:VCBS repeat-containing protein